MNTKKQVRRKEALKRLEAQLASGVKTQKGTFDTKVELTPGDRKRIEREIAVLQKAL